MTKKSQKKSNSSSKNAGGFFLAIALLIFTTFSLLGLYKIGVIYIPDSVESLFAENSPAQNAPAANISGSNKQEYFEAIPREEYATALAKMHFPDEHYRNYKIAFQSAESMYVTEYFVVKNHGDWWVQTQSDNVILQTVMCKNGNVKITDNAANTSIDVKEYSEKVPYGVSLEEQCGIMSLRSLVNIIHTVANGKQVEYGGGIADYSLSFTQTKLSGENLFSFNFVCQNGVTEEYTFSFENAVILSASKSYDGKEIYKMEIKDYRNSLDEIDLDSLFSGK